MISKGFITKWHEDKADIIVWLLSFLKKDELFVAIYYLLPSVHAGLILFFMIRAIFSQEYIIPTILLRQF